MAFTTAHAPGSGPNDVPRDSYGRYLIPRYPFDLPMDPGHEPARGEGMAQPWTRVSTLSKAVQDFEGLHAWKMRLLAKGLASRPDLYVLAASTRLDDRKQLTSVVDQALDAAEVKASANLGTALHALTDKVDAGEDVAIPAPWDKDISAYLAALEKYDIRIIPGMAEMRVVDPSLADGNAAGVAGTFDRIVMYRGRPTVADLKTGSDPLKYGAGPISIQLGRYAAAWAMWDGEFFRPMPEGLRTDVALVVHLPAGKGTCEVYEVDLEPGHGAVGLCMAVRSWRKDSKGIYRKVGDPLPEVSYAAPAEPATTDGDCLDCGPADENAAHPKSAHDDAPLPAVKPGGRACSVCRRPGHRKGSPKCSGVQVEDTESAPAIVEPPTSVEEMIEKATVCVCGARDGWSTPAWSSRPDVTVCGGCGFPSAATLARVTGERSGLGAQEPDVQEPTRVDADEPVTEDPFAEPDEHATDPHAELMAEIRFANSKAEIREIRARAKDTGNWDDEMLRAGVARLEELMNGE